MKVVIISAAAWLLASTAANAAKFDLSYTISDGNVISTVLDGTVSNGLFTVNSVDFVKLNGVASASTYSAISADALVIQGISVPGTFNIDGSFFDLYIWDQTSSAFTLNIGNFIAGAYQNPIVGASADLGGTGSTDVFDSDAYTGQLESGAVPEPASWALMLGGFGLVGGAMRGRKRATVSFG